MTGRNDAVDAFARRLVDLLKPEERPANRLQPTGDGKDPKFLNPMTTTGDLIVAGDDGAPNRLAKGLDGQVLGVDPATHEPAWIDQTGGGGGSGSDYLYYTDDPDATEPVWLMSGGAILRG